VTRSGLLPTAALAAALSSFVWLSTGCRAPGRTASPPAPEAPPAATPAVAGPESPLSDEGPEPAAPGATDGPQVTLKLVADANRKAHVFWGRKDLGVAPLEIRRPRGSGPLDLVFVAPGFLPLHTRAFTDHDETLSVRLYDEAAASGLLGHPIGNIDSTHAR
jgi:hypothetical protein